MCVHLNKLLINQLISENRPALVRVCLGISPHSCYGQLDEWMNEWMSPCRGEGRRKCMSDQPCWHHTINCGSVYFLELKDVTVFIIIMKIIIMMIIIIMVIKRKLRTLHICHARWHSWIVVSRALALVGGVLAFPWGPGPGSCPHTVSIRRCPGTKGPPPAKSWCPWWLLTSPQ